MPFKFEKLEVWQMSLDYIDLIYGIAEELPRSEAYNLRSQSSTGQTDAEQARFLGLAIRSLLETVACQHLISRREYLPDVAPLREAYRRADTLAVKLQAMRKAIAPKKAWPREESARYELENDN